jgi:hypothetical protein
MQDVPVDSFDEYPPEKLNVALACISTKILLISTPGLLAKWTSKRANRHLMEESKYYRLAVNLATVDSYMSKSSKKKKKIRYTRQLLLKFSPKPEILPTQPNSMLLLPPALQVRPYKNLSVKINQPLLFDFRFYRGKLQYNNSAYKVIIPNDSR